MRKRKSKKTRSSSPGAETRRRKSKKTMGNSPAPFSTMGMRARDILTSGYSYGQKLCFSYPSSAGTGVKAHGVMTDHNFVGDIVGRFQSLKTTVDVKISALSTAFTTVTYNVFPGTEAAISFSVPDHHKSGKVEVHQQYVRRNVAIDSCFRLKPSPLLEFAASIGSKYVSIGGGVAFDPKSYSFTMYDAGISYNKRDFSAALVWSDKGKMVKASYIHVVNRRTKVAVEMARELSSLGTGFTIGCSHRVDRLTKVKAKFCDDGKVAVLGQLEWRPKSRVTVSAEYDLKSSRGAPKFGLAVVLNP